MQCNICQSSTNPIFKLKVLWKYEIQYFQCQHCNFIQTESPFWLEEAYQDAITSTDIGLVKRNLDFSTLTEKLILHFFNKNGSFLDYGGGYGLFVRIMRDKGFDFYRDDKYCENLFAKNFDSINLPKEKNHFEMITAFEVFEHLATPLETFKDLFNKSDNILISTELQPIQDMDENWDYLAPENGQHISLFHLKTLEELAQKFDLQLHTNQHSLHLFTKNKYPDDFIQALFKPKSFFARAFYKLAHLFDKSNVPANASLLQQDWEAIKIHENTHHTS